MIFQTDFSNSNSHSALEQNFNFFFIKVKIIRTDKKMYATYRTTDGGDARNPKWDAETQVLTMDKIPICPMCKEPFHESKIFQCSYGHLFCEKCAPKFTTNYKGIKRPVKGSVPKSCTKCYQLSPQNLARNRLMEHYSYDDKNSVLELLDISTEILDPAPGPNQPPKPKHSGIFCKGLHCQKNKSNIPIQGPRYRCMECVNYDLCESCADLGGHDYHAMILIPTPDNAPAVESCLASMPPLPARMPPPPTQKPRNNNRNRYRNIYPSRRRGGAGGRQTNIWAMPVPVPNTATVTPNTATVVTPNIPIAPPAQGQPNTATFTPNIQMPPPQGQNTQIQPQNNQRQRGGAFDFDCMPF